MKNPKLTLPRQFILLLLIVGAGFGFAGKCGKKQTQKENDQFALLPIQITSPLFNYHYKTPKLATVSTINPIPEEAKETVLARVDAGLDSLFLSTEGLGYLSWNKHSDFYVMMRPPMQRSTVTGCPLLQMKNGVTVAGTVVSFFGLIVDPPIITVPENFNENEICNQMLEDGVRFEGEHIKAKYGDISIFNATLGANDNHPIYQLPAKKNASIQEETALAARYAEFSCHTEEIPVDENTPRINWKELIPTGK